jgi:hypothetical protein
MGTRQLACCIATSVSVSMLFFSVIVYPEIFLV